MAIWQLLDSNHAPIVAGNPLASVFFDDNLLLTPGDEAFDQTAAMTFATANGGTYVNYTGPSRLPADIGE